MTRPANEPFVDGSTSPEMVFLLQLAHNIWEGHILTDPRLFPLRQASAGDSDGWGLYVYSVDLSLPVERCRLHPDTLEEDVIRTLRRMRMHALRLAESDHRRRCGLPRESGVFLRDGWHLDYVAYGAWDLLHANASQDYRHLHVRFSLRGVGVRCLLPQTTPEDPSVPATD